MTINELRKKLMIREAGKKQINVAQMTEVLRHISDIDFETRGDATKILSRNGKRRATLRFQGKING